MSMSDWEFEQFERHMERLRAAEGICVICREESFFEQGTKAQRPGHIYSEAGLKEFKISQCCEYCFDGMFENEEDEYVDHGGWEDH